MSRCDVLTRDKLQEVGETSFQHVTRVSSIFVTAMGVFTVRGFV